MEYFENPYKFTIIRIPDQSQTVIQKYNDLNPDRIISWMNLVNIYPWVYLPEEGETIVMYNKFSNGNKFYQDSFEIKIINKRLNNDDSNLLLIFEIIGQNPGEDFSYG